MPKGVHQVGPPFPLRAAGGIRGEFNGIMKENVPVEHCGPEVEREGQPVPDPGIVHRFDSIKVGLEVEEVRNRRLGKGRVGESRIVCCPVGPNAELHCIDELGIAPSADPRFRIRCDVGRMEVPRECPECRPTRGRTADHPRFGCVRVAVSATAQIIEHLAVLRVCLVSLRQQRRKLGIRESRRRGDRRHRCTQQCDTADGEERNSNSASGDFHP